MPRAAAALSLTEEMIWMMAFKKHIVSGILLVLTGIFILICLPETGTFSLRSGAGDFSGSVRILSPQAFEEEMRTRTKAPFSPSGLVWQGGMPACDENETEVFVPCDPEALEKREESRTGEKGDQQDADAAQWLRILSGLAPADPGGSIGLLAEDMLETPASAMREGHAFEALLLSGDGKSFVPFRIVLTGLPVVCLEKTDDAPVVRKEVHSGRIRLLSLQKPGEEDAPVQADAAAETGASALLRCSFHVRGNIASTLKKKPFRISLLNAAGEKTKVSWLGMREDDDWILNPLYTDATRVREKTAYELWEEVSALAEVPQASSHMQYVELFMDNTYQGVYGLMEPVDGKQLGLERGDLLYKIDRWDREDPYLEQYDPAEEAGDTQILNENGFPCVEIRYPKNWDSTATWDPMQAFHSFTFRTGDPQTLSDAGLITDRDSLVNLSLYCAMTHAMDNNWKNSLLIAKKTGEQEYTLRRTIWDLNYVFGDVFIYRPEEGYTTFSAQTAFAYTPGEDSTCDYEAFLETDPAMADALREKWAQWTARGISAERICRIARQNREELVRSGAMGREKARWPGTEEEAEAFGQMEKWIRYRFLFLNDYFSQTEKAD